MPRPPLKRPRSDKQGSTARKHASSTAGLSSTPRVKLQKLLATKAIGQRPHDSDDSDRLVTRTRRGRINPNTGNTIFASGAVAEGDRPGNFPTKEERRQRLRSETNEIIRRSRSKSVEEANRVQPRSAVVEARNEVNDGSTVRSPQSAPRKTYTSSAGDKSVLGTIRPRRRQASILQLVDNNNSSIIGPGDEEQFLPDDESTPFNANKTRSSLASLTPLTRKRKSGADEAEVTSAVNIASTLSARSSSPLSDPVSLPSNLSRQRSEATTDDEIMAPPQSSSPEPSPAKPNGVAPIESKKAPPAPTTEQLQSLMPSKRRKGTRRRNQVDMFDIPPDSSPSQSDGAEEASIFQPQNKRATKTRSRQDNSSVTAPKVRSQSNKTLTTKIKSKSKSTSTVPPSVPVSTAPRTPLPLTRNSNQENRAPLPQARKSKLNGNKNKTENTGNKQKQAGGSSLPHTTVTATRNGTPRRELRSRGRMATGAESDQENRMEHLPAADEMDTESSPSSSTPPPSPPPAASSSRRSLRTRTVNTYTSKRRSVNPNLNNQTNDEDHDEMDVDMDQNTRTPLAATAKSHNSSTVISTPKSNATPLGAEAKAWQNKWKGIDDWDLDFEDVSVTTPSNSQTASGSSTADAADKEGPGDDDEDDDAVIDENASNISIETDKSSPLRGKA